MTITQPHVCIPSRSKNKIFQLINEILQPANFIVLVGVGYRQISNLVSRQIFLITSTIRLCWSSTRPSNRSDSSLRVLSFTNAVVLHLTNQQLSNHKFFSMLIVISLCTSIRLQSPTHLESRTSRGLRSPWENCRNPKDFIFPPFYSGYYEQNSLFIQLATVCAEAFFSRGVFFARQIKKNFPAIQKGSLSNSNGLFCLLCLKETRLYSYNLQKWRLIITNLSVLE